MVPTRQLCSAWRTAGGSGSGSIFLVGRGRSLRGTCVLGWLVGLGFWAIPDASMVSQRTRKTRPRAGPSRRLNPAWARRPPDTRRRAGGSFFSFVPFAPGGSDNVFSHFVNVEVRRPSRPALDGWLLRPASWAAGWGVLEGGCPRCVFSSLFGRLTVPTIVVACVVCAPVPAPAPPSPEGREAMASVILSERGFWGI